MYICLNLYNSLPTSGAETDIDEACRNKPASYVINDDGTIIYRNIECAKCHAIDPIGMYPDQNEEAIMSHAFAFFLYFWAYSCR